jgi:hypothetical protein
MARHESKKPASKRPPRQLPAGEFRRNLGVPQLEKQPGTNEATDERDWAERSPKQQDKLQRG